MRSYAIKDAFMCGTELSRIGHKKTIILS